MDSYCVKSVHDTYGVGFHRCSRKAKVERNGKAYCSQHDPQVIAERDKQRHQKWDENYIERLRISIVNEAWNVRHHSPKLAELFNEMLAQGWSAPAPEKEME